MKIYSLIAAAFLIVNFNMFNLSNNKEHIKQIEVIGNRTIGYNQVKDILKSKVGDVYNEQYAQDDFKKLLTLGCIDESGSKMEIEKVNDEIHVVFYLFDGQQIKDVRFKGLKSIAVSAIKDKMAEEHIMVIPKVCYDPVEIKRAEAMIKSSLAEVGKGKAKIDVEIETISATENNIIFNVDEE
jgi:outer membrane protein assembly factor BamA